MRRTAAVAGAVAAAALGVFLFDLIGYFSVPASMTAFAPSYRDTSILSASSEAQPQLARDYPRFYHRADEVMGFDIAPGAKASAKVDGHRYEIFASRLGCFDRNDVRNFQARAGYAYFAGDSFTWGYADYDDKFATIWEAKTGKPAAKCGVTHSGQRHQFDKFQRVTREIGRMPEVAFVGFFANDPANDLAYPHTTVIDGYQVNTAFIRNGAVVRPDIEDLRAVVRASIRELEASRTGYAGRLANCLRVYSLSANLLSHGANLLVAASKRSPTAGGNAAQGMPSTPTSQFGDDLYSSFTIPEALAHYGDDSRADANKAAIRRWRAHSRENSYRLVLILIPAKANFNDTGSFAVIRDWLSSEGIEYVDLTQLFAKGGYGVSDLYWTVDGHWNPRGNRVVGEYLATLYR